MSFSTCVQLLFAVLLIALSSTELYAGGNQAPEGQENHECRQAAHNETITVDNCSKTVEILSCSGTCESLSYPMVYSERFVDQELL